MNVKRIRSIWRFSALLLMILLLAGHAWAIETYTGRRLLDISLPTPQTETHRTYLGLPDTLDNTVSSFTIPQIKARVILVEVFSMYCPHCQKAAPELNKLYELIQSSHTHKDAIKLLGIGVGNSDFEVAYFQKTYQIPFPLFSDPEFVIHKRLGEIRTPFFIGIKLPENGQKPEIFLSGGSDGKTPQDFFDLLTTISDL